MASTTESGGNKLVITAAALAAGLVAQKGLGLAWRLVRGTEPSKDDDSPLVELLIFAAVSAAVAATAKNWVTHQAEQRMKVDSPA